MGNTHWNNKEIRRLKRLFREGLTDAQISKDIGRPESGVKGKRVELGLHRRGAKRKRHARKPRPAVPPVGNGIHVDEDHPYAVIVRGPNRELAMAVDSETGLAVLQLMLGVND